MQLMRFLNRPPRRLKIAFLLLGGIAMFLAGGWFAFANADFLRGAARAQGLVIDVVGQRGARGMTLYHPVVRYRLGDREAVVVFKSKPGLWPSPFDVGDRVTVAYDARRPENAKIVSVWTLWFLPGTMMLLGSACVIAARHV